MLFKPSSGNESDDSISSTEVNNANDGPAIVEVDGPGVSLPYGLWTSLSHPYFMYAYTQQQEHLR
jgi:hypothetical protein